MARPHQPEQGGLRLAVPRFCRPHLAAPIGAGLIAAVCAVVAGCGSAMAQITVPGVTDPLAPNLQSDPRKPPRFQKFDRSPTGQLGAPTVFTAPPSAAGDTGFDSTNSRKTKSKAAKAKSQTSPRAGSAPGAAPAISPYQKPFLTSGESALAAPRGSAPAGLDPIRRPPVKRKAHSEPDDPYAPLGVKAGSFLLFPAVELSGGYNTNPSQSTNAKGAKFYTVAPEMRLQSDWSRHELKADLRGSYTGYSPDSEPTLSRPNVNAKADGRIDVTRTTRIDLGGRVQVSTDNPGSPDLQAGLAKLPIYTTTGGSAGLGQKFNRFDLSLKGDAERTVYQDSSLTDGSTVSNEDRNYNQYGVTLRGGYELTPGVTPFLEAHADTRKHDLAVDTSGYQRDSKGMTGKAGTSFELSRLLSGEISLGYTKRNYDDARLAQLSGLIGDASLVWTASALTTVKLTAASAIGESTVAGVSGVLYRDVGLQIDHAFRRWLIGNVKFAYGQDDYVGLSREDNRYSAGVGLTYKINRNTQLKGEIRQDWLRSNVTGNDYTANVFMLGLRFQQ